MSKPYAQQDFVIADKFELKSGVAVKRKQALVKTGNITSNNKIELDIYSGSYNPEDIIGTSNNDIAADYPYRTIAVTIKGVDLAKISEDVDGLAPLIGSDAQLTETFDGDNSAQQEIQTSVMPISSIVSVIEDPSGTPTVLTREYTGTPAQDEYYINLETGEIIIGGTSVSGTDNYQVIYNIEGMFKPYVENVDNLEIAEEVTVSTHVGQTAKLPSLILSVNATAGSSTGLKTIIYSGTPSAGQVLVDLTTGEMTFATADAVTTAEVTYKNRVKPVAWTLKQSSAGEQGEIYIQRNF